MILIFVITSNNKTISEELGTILRMIMISSTFFISIYYIYYCHIQINSYSRTEKGEEVNKKIEGLKKYIIDYSLLYEKDKEDLSVWEEYLIYTVIFDINNTTILEEMSKLIEIKTEYGEQNCLRRKLK